jgi:hypothetical protein
MSEHDITAAIHAAAHHLADPDDTAAWARQAHQVLSDYLNGSYRPACPTIVRPVLGGHATVQQTLRSVRVTLYAAGAAHDQIPFDPHWLD